MENTSLDRLPTSLNNVGDANVGSSNISQSLVKDYTQHIDRFRAVVNNLQTRNLTGSISSGAQGGANAINTGGITDRANVAGGPGQAVVVAGVNGDRQDASRVNNFILSDYNKGKNITS